MAVGATQRTEEVHCPFEKIGPQNDDSMAEPVGGGVTGTGDRLDLAGWLGYIRDESVEACHCMAALGQAVLIERWLTTRTVSPGTPIQWHLGDRLKITSRFDAAIL